jgi:heat shock protein HslJ
MAFASTLHCGDQVLTMGFDGDTLLLHIGDERLRLHAPTGGPYTLFSVPGDPGTSFLSQSRGGTLKLHGRFLPECTDAATPARRLADGEWVIEEIGSSSGGGGVIDNSRATLVFAADGVLAGRASCNLYRTHYTLTEATLAVSKPTLTDKVCAASLMQQEARFLDLLLRAQRYSFSDTGALLLDTADGQRLLARRQ